MRQEFREFCPRRDSRYQVDIAGEACRADRSPVSVQVRDVSYDGCQIVSKEVFLSGEFVTLKLPDAEDLRAQIRWCQGNRAGARFLRS